VVILLHPINFVSDKKISFPRLVNKGAADRALGSGVTSMLTFMIFSLLDLGVVYVLQISELLTAENFEVREPSKGA